MNERIKQVRIMKGLNQFEFAERIGISQSALQKLEYGTNHPRENTLQRISTEFHVSRLWLEEGIEPMLIEAETADEMIDEKLAHGSEFAKALLRVIAKMPDEDLAAVERLFSALREELDKKPGE